MDCNDCNIDQAVNECGPFEARHMIFYKSPHKQKSDNCLILPHVTNILRGKHTHGVEYLKLTTWIEENIKGAWTARSNFKIEDRENLRHNIKNDYMQFKFEFEEDAIMFKLTWD